MCCPEAHGLFPHLVHTLLLLHLAVNSLCFYPSSQQPLCLENPAYLLNIWLFINQSELQIFTLYKKNYSTTHFVLNISGLKVKVCEVIGSNVQRKFLIA